MIRVNVYNGQKLRSGLWLVCINEKILSPVRSQQVHNHSPDGFAWGYEGSGPAQLALAILLEEGIDAERACWLHQSFKRDVVAKLGPAWWLSSTDVARWLDGLPDVPLDQT